MGDKNNCFKGCGKVFLMLSMVLLMSLSMVSAFEFDNVKDYDPETKTATITNAFGLGDIIAEITLKTPEVNYVIRGKNRLVASFEINNMEDYNNVFNKLDFYYANDDMRKFNRDFNYRYKTYEEYGVPEFKEQCEYSEINQTEQCENVRSGTKIMQRAVWNDFDSKAQLPPGKITIGIFTDVYPGDYVDWVPELFGVRINEWAVWSESLNSGITSYFNFNGTENNLPNLVNASNNGTGSLSQINWTLDGIIGNASGFNSSYVINVTDSVWNNDSAGISISFWFQPTTLVVASDLLATHLPATDDLFIQIDGTNQLQVWAGDMAGSIATIVSRDWRHIVVTMNFSGGENSIVYINGSEVLSSAVGGKLAENTGLIIGASFNGADKAKANIDELGIWNRVLSPTEITQLYNGGVGITYRDEFGLDVTLDTPENDTEFLLKPIGFNATHSTTTSTLKNTTLMVWNSTGLYAINETDITGTANETNLSITFTDPNIYKWNFYTCSLEKCAFATNNNTIQISRFLMNAITFNNETVEGTTEKFTSNITLAIGESLSSAVFWYDDVAYPSIIVDSVDNKIIRNTITIPSVAPTTNKTFFWEFLFASGSSNSSLTNQTVFNFSMDDCSVSDNPLFNFSLIDEEEQNLLDVNTSIDLFINIFSKDKSVLVLNFSNNFSNINPVEVCLNQNISNVSSSYLLDSTIKYSADERVIEYYNIINLTLNNQTGFQNISLFDLLSSDSTEFQITFTGSDFLPVENALIFIKRQYVDENLFKVVELPKTDSGGQTIAHLVRNDIIYNIEVTFGNVVIGSFPNIIAFCEDFSIGDCKINLDASSSGTPVFDYNDELGIRFTTPTLDNSTRTINFNFLSVDGTAKNVVINTTRNDILGNITVCHDSITSSGATMFCEIPPYISDTLLITTVFVDGVETIKVYIPLDQNNYGVGGYYIFFIWMLALILMFNKSEELMLVGILLGFISGITLGLINGVAVGLGSSGIWLIIVIILMIWKKNQGRPN